MKLPPLNALVQRLLTGRREPAPAPTRTEAVSAPSALRPLKSVEGLDGKFTGPAQFNSNHPEILTALPDGKLLTLSTLSPAGKAHPTAHQGHSFQGDFRVMTSHQNRTGRPAVQNLVLHNPSDRPVTVKVRAFASHTALDVPYPDAQEHVVRDARGALVRTLPVPPAEAVVEDAAGRLANGPGDAVARDILRGRNLAGMVRELVIPPGASAVLSSLPHPHGTERVTQAELSSDGPVQMAEVYTRGKATLPQLERTLQSSNLVPRDAHHDRVPSVPGAGGSFIYGRVAGVVPASTFDAQMTNDTGRKQFLLTGTGTQRFAVNTKTTQRLGTGVDGAAPVATRYADSAYASHANYGGEFKVGGAFRNTTHAPLTVSVYLDTPPEARAGVSRSLRNTVESVVRESPDSDGARRYLYANQTEGTVSSRPLATVTVPPGATRHVELRMFYAANNTSPHVLRVETAAAR